MPRFFFHIRSDSNGWSWDDRGVDFPNAETAPNKALLVSQGLKGVFAARGEDPRHHAIEIENEAGKIVSHLPFSEIFDEFQRRCSSSLGLVRVKRIFHGQLMQAELALKLAQEIKAGFVQADPDHVPGFARALPGVRNPVDLRWPTTG